MRALILTNCSVPAVYSASHGGAKLKTDANIEDDLINDAYLLLIKVFARIAEQREFTGFGREHSRRSAGKLSTHTFQCLVTCSQYDCLGKLMNVFNYTLKAFDNA